MFCVFVVPEIIDGNTLTATVVDLNSWVEYEFRVLARNSVGVGEPSPVSVKTRTEDAGAVNTFHLLIQIMCLRSALPSDFDRFLLFIKSCSDSEVRV